jgi:hypothetical protein
MIFKKSILDEIFKLVEDKHKKDFWVVFMENVKNVVDVNDPISSGASEYEIYFSYINKFHKNEFKIRKLKWENNSKIPKKDLNYVTLHHYNRDI